MGASKFSAGLIFDKGIWKGRGKALLRMCPYHIRRCSLIFRWIGAVVISVLTSSFFIPCHENSSTCPPEHLHFCSIQLPLLCFTHFPALTAVKGWPDYCSVELAFNGPGAFAVAKDSCGLPSKAAFILPLTVSHSSFLG